MFVTVTNLKLILTLYKVNYIKMELEKQTEKKRKVFLGGTCNGSTWREKLIPLLTNNYFNPVVENWTTEYQEEEIRQRETCDLCLYVITPKMTGVYSIAEVVDDSNKRPEKTVYYFSDEHLEQGEHNYEITHPDGSVDLKFTTHQVKSLIQVGKMVQANGGFWATTKEELLEKLNAN